MMFPRFSSESSGREDHGCLSFASYATGISAWPRKDEEEKLGRASFSTLDAHVMNSRPPEML